MAVGVITIPILVRHLGIDRFAVITIAWMLIGYFSLFDMGLGRALTQLIAEKIGKNRYEDIPGIFWTSMSLMLVFSIIGALALAVLATPLVHSVLKVPLSLQSETITALYFMAFSIPFVIMTAALVGVLTAYHRFDIINAIRIPMGTYSYAAPLLILPFSSNLVPIIAALLFGRVVTFVIHLRYCLQIAPDLRTTIVIQKSIIKPLFKFGGWMTVSNILGPFMVYFDRFLIGSIISITAVAYYTTPYELITKLWIIPGALMNVLFPAFASTYTADPLHTAVLFQRAVRYQLLGIFPLVFIIVAGAHQGFTLWLGSAFADSSYRVLQWLAIGVLINCLAQVPFSFLQGIGKPDVTSKLHVSELLLYIPALWFLVKSFGITGAAIAWTGRVALDTVLLFYATRSSFRPLSGITAATGFCALAATACLVCIMFLPEGNLSFVINAAVLMLLMTAGWMILLSVNERSYLLDKLSVLKFAK
jgi:O-antigen/teichoic acid export membrane protein